MSTFLFDDIIFGPVFSRRLGVSLGINLLPAGRKICNFNCIYCECGNTQGKTVKGERMPTRAEVKLALQKKLVELSLKESDPDAITFAGNGEPTLHPEFAGIVEDVILLRDSICPGSTLAILSNSTTAGDPYIKKALMRIDKRILKLDSALNDTLMSYNCPGINITAGEIIDNLVSFRGDLILQAMFVRGTYQGKRVDNTTPREVEAWVDAVKKINPEEVQLHTISRDTPVESDLEAISAAELDTIARQIKEMGIRTQVSA